MEIFGQFLVYSINTSCLEDDTSSYVSQVKFFTDYLSILFFRYFIVSHNEVAALIIFFKY